MNFKPNSQFLVYLYWMKERMNIFWNRYFDNPQPFTEDPIFSKYKFTNVYRVLDRSSQYMVKNVIYNGNTYSREAMFWRIMLYKHFNLPGTWDYLIQRLGDIDEKTSFSDISRVLLEYEAQGSKPYSNAYMMTAAFLSGTKGKYVHMKGNGWKKYQLYFYVFEKELTPDYVKALLDSNSPMMFLNGLRNITSFGDFIAYQIIQDLCYSEVFDFDLNTFCLAGVGTIKGIERCFDISGKADYGEIVMWVQQNIDILRKTYSEQSGMDLTFNGIPGLEPMVPDYSNIFCESDKYLRALGSKTEGKEIEGERMKNFFTPSPNRIEYCFPPKWGVKI